MRLQIFGLFFFLLLQAGPGQAESISILTGPLAKAETQEALATEYLKRLLEERSAGRLQVKIEHRQDLTKAAQALQGLEKQQWQIVLLSAASLEPTLPNLSIYTLPFLFHNRQHLQRTIDGEAGAQISHPSSAGGLKPLAIWDGAANQLLTKTTISKPDGRIAQSLVAKTSGNGWLETSLVEADRQARQSESEVLTLTDHRYSVNILLTTESFWKRLPEDLKVIAGGAIKDATSYARELAEQADQKALKSLRADRQLAIYPLGGKNRVAWEKTMLKVFRKSLAREKMAIIAIITGQVTN